MAAERRYLFQGHAVAASAQFRRSGDDPIQVDNCLKNASAAIPADGGCLTASSGRQEIRHKDELLFSFESAFASVKGDYLDQRAAFLQTQQEHRDQELGVFTACEAILKNLNVLNRLTIENIECLLTAEDPRKGAPVRFVAPRTPVINGIVLEGKPVVVVIDPDDPFLKLGTKQDVEREHEGDSALRRLAELRHFWSHEKNIVVSIVKQIDFPKGLPPGVTRIGHNILKVRDFGTIFFGEFVIGEDTRRLTLLRLQLGSQTGGSACAGESKPNGQTT